MEKIVSPGFLSGTLRMLPSKSASHRAVMMAAMAQGKTLLEPLQLSQDISATLSCAEALGLTGAGLRRIRLDSALFYPVSAGWAGRGAL